MLNRWFGLRAAKTKASFCVGRRKKRSHHAKRLEAPPDFASLTFCFQSSQAAGSRPARKTIGAQSASLADPRSFIMASLRQSHAAARARSTVSNVMAPALLGRLVWVKRPANRGAYSDSRRVGLGRASLD